MYKLCYSVPLGAWLNLILHWLNLATDAGYVMTVPWEDPYWQVSAMVFLAIAYVPLIFGIIICGLCGVCSKSGEGSTILTLMNFAFGTRQIYDILKEKDEDSRMQLVLALWFTGM